MRWLFQVFMWHLFFSFFVCYPTFQDNLWVPSSKCKWWWWDQQAALKHWLTTKKGTLCKYLNNTSYLCKSHSGCGVTNWTGLRQVTKLLHSQIIGDIQLDRTHAAGQSCAGTRLPLWCAGTRLPLWCAGMRLPLWSAGMRLPLWSAGISMPSIQIQRLWYLKFSFNCQLINLKAHW